MKRREFITLVGGAAAAWPLAARAQKRDRVKLVGVLMGTTADDIGRTRFEAFRMRFQALGWTETKCQIEVRFASPNDDRVGALAKELVELQPDVLVAGATFTTRALRLATKTIPIVFVNVSDPVGQGFVASLARPGGNVTGFSNVEEIVAQKWLEILKEIAPRITRVALLFNPDTSAYTSFLKTVEPAAKLFAVKLTSLPVRNPGEIERAFTGFARETGGGVVVLPDVFNTTNHALIIDAAARKPPAGHLSLSLLFHQRRARVVWNQYHRQLQTRRRIR